MYGGKRGTRPSAVEVQTLQVNARKVTLLLHWTSRRSRLKPWERMWEQLAAICSGIHWSGQERISRQDRQISGTHHWWDKQRKCFQDIRRTDYIAWSGQTRQRQSPHKSDITILQTLLCVPSNLYIIGTMNTTDRSTGTLDYALRRRFAFVTLKSDPNVIVKHYEKLGNDDLKAIAIDLFNNIKAFITNPRHLCGDLCIDDLMVGHSYFMASSKEELQCKVEFEIIPLIAEYINDGILTVNDQEKEKAFDAWTSLHPCR